MRQPPDPPPAPLSPPPAFGACVGEHGAGVLRLLVGMVGPQEAEDCFAETFLKALRAWPPEQPELVGAWLRSIAHRTALDALRRRGREVAVEAVPDRAGAALDLGLLEADDLWRAVRGLPARQRAAVVLRVVLDLSFAQVAETVGCSEAAARRSHADGIAALRRRVEDGTVEVVR